MLGAEVYASILGNLSCEDLDTLLVTNRQLGSLSRLVLRGMSPRRVSLRHHHAGQYRLCFDRIAKAVAFGDLQRYLHGSHLTDVELDATTLDVDTLQGTTWIIGALRRDSGF